MIPEIIGIPAVFKARTHSSNKESSYPSNGQLLSLPSDTLWIGSLATILGVVGGLIAISDSMKKKREIKVVLYFCAHQPPQAEKIFNNRASPLEFPGAINTFTSSLEIHTPFS
jgi:hypothetical protein